MPDAPPDVVIVVLDCVRADLFDEELAAGHLPYLASAAPAFVRYPRAVAPASWTIPSHASLFTGRYPWDHGAHYKSGAILGSSPPTLAERLRGRGYRTASISANGYVQPGTGLTRGFDSAVWGGDREFFLRVVADRPSCPVLNGADAAVHAILDRAPTAASWRVGAMRALSRFTPVCDALNRLGGHVRGRSPALVGSWIETEFARAIDAAGSGPAFAFVNLLEAHEPYFADAGLPVALRDWLAFARTTQVSQQWTRGENAPSARDLAWARRDYRSALRVLDGRLRSLSDVLRSRGRWDRALVVITSDHGQAFGEDGHVYHRLRLEEGITRVPLWIKFPGGVGTVAGGGWATLADLPTTVAAAVGAPEPFGDPTTVALTPGGPPVGRLVFAMTDGVSSNEAGTLPPGRRAEIDRVQIAAYGDGRKTVVDQDGAARSWGFDSTPGSAPTTIEVDATAVAEIRPKLEAVLRLPPTTTVSQRIAGWGY